MATKTTRYGDGSIRPANITTGKADRASRPPMTLLDERSGKKLSLRQDTPCVAAEQRFHALDSDGSGTIASTLIDTADVLLLGDMPPGALVYVQDPTVPGRFRLLKLIGGEPERPAEEELLRPLQGRRVAILVGDGFEQVELTIPRAALRVAGASVDVVSTRSGKIRGMNLHLPGRKIRVDRTLDEANASEYDALFIPGGFINPDLLRQSAAARGFVREFALMNKPIASICHGPWLLISAGLAHGRHVTSWPGLRDDLVNAGARWTDEPVVRDGGWVTSRGPQDLPAFISAMIDVFAGARAPTIGEGESSPPPDEAPGWAIAPMAAITLPRLLLGAAAIGGAIVLARRAA